MSEMFQQLSEAKDLESRAYAKIALLAKQRRVTAEQLMTIANLATSVPCNITIHPAALQGQATTQPAPRVVKTRTRIDEVREEMLPAVGPLAPIPHGHETRVLAAVITYKLLKALKMPTSMAGEAKTYGCTYNRLEKMLTAARYLGGGQATRAKSASKRKADTPDEVVDIPEDEEEQERQEAEEPPTEPRQHLPRKAKEKSASPTKRARTATKAKGGDDGGDAGGGPDQGDGDEGWGEHPGSKTV